MTDGVTYSLNDLTEAKEQFDTFWPSETQANIPWAEGKSGCYKLNSAMNFNFIMSILRAVILFFISKTVFCTDVWWI